MCSSDLVRSYCNTAYDFTLFLILVTPARSQLDPLPDTSRPYFLFHNDHRRFALQACWSSKYPSPFLYLSLLSQLFYCSTLLYNQPKIFLQISIYIAIKFQILISQYFISVYLKLLLSGCFYDIMSLHSDCRASSDSRADARQMPRVLSDLQP